MQAVWVGLSSVATVERTSARGPTLPRAPPRRQSTKSTWTCLLQSIHWTATALFSPSKARAHQAQARDWASVEQWLIKHYGKRLPAFERSEDTLQALLTVAAYSEDAAEQRTVTERIVRSALEAQSKRSSEREGIHGAMLASFDQDETETLDGLAGAAVLLGSTELGQMCGRICEVTAEAFEVSQQLKRAEAQHAVVEGECARVERTLDTLSADDFQAPTNVLEDTAGWTRSTKTLRAKLIEYDERLNTARSNAAPSHTLDTLTQQAAELASLRNRVQVLNVELLAFDSLPAEPKAARAQLERARTDLRRLVAHRDQLFETLDDDG
ncbi:hypothetical protein LTR53_001691 [Teratosphaeriaceae sp. CCFEE 6253]|nr:hypothetical protein LTR53_001691 [Teratosphaeriaceae sp. CCFEE 6253]